MSNPKYDAYLQSPEWKVRRKIALDHAGNRCQLCNTEQQPLHVHHRTYERMGKEQAADLVVLCETCHRRHHSIEPFPQPSPITVRQGIIVDDGGENHGYHILLCPTCSDSHVHIVNSLVKQDLTYAQMLFECEGCGNPPGEKHTWFYELVVINGEMMISYYIVGKNGEVKPCTE